jgi:hypothetical protein
VQLSQACGDRPAALCAAAIPVKTAGSAGRTPQRRRQPRRPGRGKSRASMRRRSVLSDRHLEAVRYPDGTRASDLLRRELST